MTGCGQGFAQMGSPLFTGSIRERWPRTDTAEERRQLAVDVDELAGAEDEL